MNPEAAQELADWEGKDLSPDAPLCYCACPDREGQERGLPGSWRLLTTGESQPKILKSMSKGVYSGVLHLAPADRSGQEMCRWRSPGCTAVCLNTAGRGEMSSIQAIRAGKTQRFHSEREAFMHELVRDVASIREGARRRGMVAAVRLNGTSDWPWEATGFDWEPPSRARTPLPPAGHYRNLMQAFPEVQFYDYTKSRTRVLRSLGRAPGAERWPATYHLTYSYSELPQARDTALEVLAAGGNVAAVFRDRIPASWEGYPVVDATKHDARFLDPPGSVAGLRALGKAKGDRSGFVIDPEAPVPTEAPSESPSEHTEGQSRRRHGHLRLELFGRSSDRAARRAGVR